MFKIICKFYYININILIYGTRSKFTHTNFNAHKFLHTQFYNKISQMNFSWGTKAYKVYVISLYREKE